jgi:tetratricopeptide (TPR) repeat protein
MLRIFLIVSLIFCGACSSGELSIVEEAEERQFKLAKEFQSQGRHEDALITYLGLISVRRESPESHLEVGYIYLQTLKDPVRAIFYFDRYLELKPESERIIQVKQLIETAKLEFLRQLPTKPFQSDVNRIDLLEIIEKLKKENDSLKLKYNKALLEIKAQRGQEAMNQISIPLNEIIPNDGNAIQGEQSLNTTSNITSMPNSAGTLNPQEVPKSYVVQSGDTLSKISEKFYGTANRWNDIYQANRDTLSSARSLRVGQELLIP